MWNENDIINPVVLRFSKVFDYDNVRESSPLRPRCPRRILRDSASVVRLRIPPITEQMFFPLLSLRPNRRLSSARKRGPVIQLGKGYLE